MAEDKESRTEAATPRRRQEARESGQTSKSVDLTSAALLVVGLYILSIVGKGMVDSLADIMREMLRGDVAGVAQNDVQDMLADDIHIHGPRVVSALMPLMLTVAGAAILVVGMQVGFKISGKPLMPSLSKLNPLKGLGQLFAGRNGMRFVMNLMKLVIILGVAWAYIQAELPVIISLYSLGFPENFTTAAEIVFNLAWRLAWALLILAALDWLYQKYRFERDIRMTKQEIKDEAKRMEGDQEIKGRRRQLARKMIMQRIHAEVPRADVVITNPTELAIALKYDPEAMGAPRVVAKGAGFLAARIRQIAVQNGVAIVERKPLAQALYKTVDVGQEVPAQFYQAIAEILAYVYELAGKGARTLKRAG